MAVFGCFKNAKVIINSVDLSDHVRQVTINYSAEMLEKTAMGDNGKTRVAGLLDFSVDVEFNQDYASGKVDATLFPLVGAAAFPIAINPTNAAVSPTNPTFSGNVLLETYPPLGGNVGALLTTTAKFSGDGVLTRATA